ncbi:MAG: helix-turn-helix domain-containing protein [Dehalococcoidales bacterium]|nr:helix-turn-helix domain-containing protein [Dehalococcoidales bacterium]
MSEFEKLYTVEDIAKMTSLTSRTIRNYLKDGSLQGRKIGGQWRFTFKDIQKLFDNSSYRKDISVERKQQIMDFIDGVNTDIQGDIQVCTVADCYCENRNAGQKTYEKLVTVINNQPDGAARARFDYEYIEKENKARFTLFGSPEFIIETLRQLQ